VEDGTYFDQETGTCILNNPTPAMVTSTTPRAIAIASTEYKHSLMDFVNVRIPEVSITKSSTTQPTFIQSSTMKSTTQQPRPLTSGDYDLSKFVNIRIPEVSITKSSTTQATYIQSSTTTPPKDYDLSKFVMCLSVVPSITKSSTTTPSSVTYWSVCKTNLKMILLLFASSVKLYEYSVKSRLVPVHWAPIQL
jgi:hypothetical protein